mgnify:CR=1 FL=1
MKRPILKLLPQHIGIIFIIISYVPLKNHFFQTFFSFFYLRRSFGAGIHGKKTKRRASARTLFCSFIKRPRRAGTAYITCKKQDGDSRTGSRSLRPEKTGRSAIRCPSVSPFNNVLGYNNRTIENGRGSLLNCFDEIIIPLLRLPIHIFQ